MPETDKNIYLALWVSIRILKGCTRMQIRPVFVQLCVNVTFLEFERYAGAKIPEFLHYKTAVPYPVLLIGKVVELYR